MSRRLEEIYGRPEDEEWVTGPGHDADFCRAFQDYGIDIAALPVAEAANRIGAQRIRLELVRALDFWSSRRLPVGDQLSRDWMHLIDMAQVVDPDPWRNQLREALKRKDRGALKKLVAFAEVSKLSPQTVSLAARSLANFPGTWRPRAEYQDDLQQAVNLLRQAQPQHPNDYWINISLGFYHLLLRQFDDSIRFYTAALAIRPRRSNPMSNLGVAFLEKGMFAEAVQVLSEAITLKTDNRNAWSNLGMAYKNLNQPNRALASFNKALELDPNCADARIHRGILFESLRQWQRAVDDLSMCSSPTANWHRAYACSVLGYWRQAALSLAPNDMEKTPPGDDLWLQLACLRLLEEDTLGYRQLCRQLRDRGAEGKQDHQTQTAYMVSRTCLLFPQDAAEQAVAIQLAERAVAQDSKAPWSLHTLALAHYRAGHFEQSLSFSRDSQKAGLQWRGGKRQTILALTKWHDSVLKGTHRLEADSPPNMHLSDWLAFQVLYREAKLLFGEEVNKPTH